ncbi:IS66 family insertion sequence element accessory protein TnpB [Roseobacter sp. OBYS 0001]
MSCTGRPTIGAVFAFSGKRDGRTKLLHWDGQGFCLIYRVLQ